MANKYNWKICKYCQMPFIPYLGEGQEICSWFCELKHREKTGQKRDCDMSERKTTVVCANCKNEIPAGVPYLIVGDNYLQMKYFDSPEDNIFCSNECVCEALSVIEIPNDGSKTLSEEMGLVPDEMNTQILKISAGVYPEDAEVNGVEEPDRDEEDDPEYKMPGLVKDEHDSYFWNATIDISTGKIIGWPQGTTAKTWYKTADCCGLKYLGKSYEDYAPDFLEIWDEDCGDYIYIEILEDGSIKDWDAEACRKWLRDHIEEFN